MRISELFESIQGEGPLAGTRAIFIRTHGCNLSCPWCFGGNTEVVMSDFTKRKISDIKINDEVLGVMRDAPGMHLKFVPSKVNNVTNRIADTVRINEKTVVTPDHIFLNTEYRENWQSIQSLNEHSVKSVDTINIDYTSKEYMRGYLQGVSDGDGNWHMFHGDYLRYKLCSIDPLILDRIELFGSTLGWELRRITHQAASTTIPGVECTQSYMNEKIRKLLERIPEDGVNYDAGYLAGIYDAEGTAGTPNEIRISQKSGSITDTIMSKAEHLGYRVSTFVNAEDMNTIRILNPMRFIIECQPCSSKRLKHIGVAIGSVKSYKEVSLTANGSQTVYDLTTFTGNFIADGFVVHNCDTKYAWSDANFMELTIDQILDYTNRSPGIKHIVITGGEPTVQMADLQHLVYQLKEYGRHVTLETNGIEKPTYELFAKLDLIMVSPKSLAVADEWLQDAIENKNVEFKFVIGPQEIKLIPEWIRSKGLTGIYLMPMGTGIDELITGSHAIMAAMLEYHLDCIVSPRVHLFLGVK
jgi:organic radical activating enzyme